MTTRKIPQEQWDPYFNALSNRAHTEHPLVTVTVQSEEAGVEPVAEHAPLRAIFYEEKGSEGGSLDIEVGDDVTGDRLVQRLNARIIWVEESAQGEPVALDIEGVDPSSRATVKTIVRFESSSR